LRGLAPKTSFWRDAQFDTIRLSLIKVAGRVTEMVTRIKIALPTAYPYQIGFAALAGRIATTYGLIRICPGSRESVIPQWPHTKKPTESADNGEDNGHHRASSIAGSGRTPPR
jgi:DDE family transposase